MLDGLGDLVDTAMVPGQTVHHREVSAVLLLNRPQVPGHIHEDHEILIRSDLLRQAAPELRRVNVSSSSSSRSSVTVFPVRLLLLSSVGAMFRQDA